MWRVTWEVVPEDLVERSFELFEDAIEHLRELVYRWGVKIVTISFDPTSY